ncbi:MAG: hypothetical protein DME33_06060 [Verrucomicrobia bacterium]|nr:MAG: hypothetical protein DME33_06060 [Verrucomicrobiota bacterium]
MKRKIRWLKTVRLPLPSPAEWRPVREIPKATQMGRYTTFKKGTETIVSIRGSSPPIVSVPRIGALTHLAEGEHFEFIEEPLKEQADHEDKLLKPPMKCS